MKSWENSTSIACIFATLPVYCSHFTLGNPKSHFQRYYSYILLSQNNAPAHTSAQALAAIQNAGFQLLRQSVTLSVRYLCSYCTADGWLEDQEQQFFYNGTRACAAKNRPLNNLCTVTHLNVLLYGTNTWADLGGKGAMPLKMLGLSQLFFNTKHKRNIFKR